MKSSKYLLLLILMAIGCINQLYAQPRIAREVHLGTLGGTVMSEYSFQPKVTQDMATGYTFGIGARYIEEKYFGLLAEFHLTRRGMRDHFDEEFPGLKFQRNFTYIEMPVLAHVYFNLGKKSEIAFDAGPKFCYLIAENTESSLNGESWDKALQSSYHGYRHHDMPVSRKMDYGIQAGLGYEFKLSDEMSIQLQGRYYYGLSNLFADAKSDVFEVSTNQQIQIVAAIWFRKQIAKYIIKHKQKNISKKKAK